MNMCHHFLPHCLLSLLDDKHNENDAGEKEEIRLPLKPCQSHQMSSEGPNKKQKKKVMDKTIYPITEVLTTCFFPNVWLTVFHDQISPST